ncbi:hypothetical protein AB0G76_36915 [Streptomyces asoensis]|uniref:hypothetical protein n=1 Tax=Streptomyces asoensis TaxID=249586 RepID=UPI0033C40BA8
MAPAKLTPRQLVVAELGRIDLIDFVFHREQAADQILAVIADRMRDEIGPNECGCGGCDSCVQHALLDWLDPR